MHRVGELAAAVVMSEERGYERRHDADTLQRDVVP